MWQYALYPYQKRAEIAGFYLSCRNRGIVDSMESTASLPNLHNQHFVADLENRTLELELERKSTVWAKKCQVKFGQVPLY
jgi:hypothetical protein